jgi:hypothetical protein
MPWTMNPSYADIARTPPNSSQGNDHDQHPNPAPLTSRVVDEERDRPTAGAIRTLIEKDPSDELPRQLAVQRRDEGRKEREPPQVSV